ncbi:MAG: ABC transporter ATP-binding protein, partial [Kiloniellales bacterium]|nr:ABC transporter ATP-binding protein [Kiloniellales bacterium]
MGSEDLLELHELTKRFDVVTAVESLSFAVKRGEVLGFLGPNGAGKSTTMKMITGYLQPSAGTAILEGFDVRKNPLEVKRRVGYLPEGAPLYGEMTPSSLFRFVADCRGLSARARSERTSYVVERLELQNVYGRPIETLSKGFKRRVGLA